MIVFPNCKINLGLHILQKRNDGYHNLETVFYPLPLKDIVEIVPSKNSMNFSCSGLLVNGEHENNLCLKAYQLLKKDFPQLPSVQIHLHKTIPIGAGLGGGSSDGAFTLTLLNQKFNLELSTEKLINYALQLGSDCPFFIINEPCVATGRGELLEEIKLDLSQFRFLIISPGIHIDTAWAFSKLNLPGRDNSKSNLKEIIHQPVETWKKDLVNDFEAIAFHQFPEIKKIKEKLYQAGAVYSSMSGSGSSVYGIFEKDNKINLPLPEKYFIKEIHIQ